MTLQNGYVRFGGSVCDNPLLLLFSISEKNREDVCYVAQTHQVDLETEETFTMEYWYNKDSSNAINCHFWCNADGDLPVPYPESNIREGVIDAVVRSVFKIK